MQTLTSAQRSLLESQTSQYESSLVLAEDYLVGRGITEDTAAMARLGVVDEPLEFDDDATGNYLSIPYLARAGVVSLRFRCIREHNCKDVPYHGKYRTRLGDRTRIYGVEHLVSAGPAICITEGELDALILNQLGYPAVALPGAKTWKSHYRRLFEDFSRIIVFADGDHDGTEFGAEWQKIFPRSVEVAQMDEKEDVNSMFLLYGEDYFHDILDG